MPAFHDRITGQSGSTQYINYLQNQIYVRELKKDTSDAINYQLTEIRRAIGNDTEQNKQSFENLNRAVCRTLENGFKQIINELEDANWQLNEINQSIDGLHTMLDWKIDLL